MAKRQSIPEATKKICADILLSLSVQLLAQRCSISLEEALDRLIHSPAYNAMYDYETGLWQEGPVYFLNFYEQCLAIQENKADAQAEQ